MTLRTLNYGNYGIFLITGSILALLQKFIFLRLCAVRRKWFPRKLFERLGGPQIQNWLMLK